MEWLDFLIGFGIGLVVASLVFGIAYGELECINFKEKLYQHIHVTMEPKPPGGIGLEPGCYKVIHTHFQDGWIHLESNAPRNFTLAEFFEEWGLGTDGRSVEINYKNATFATPLKDGDKIVVYGLSLRAPQ
jgi:hypothetical protein